jgi:ABC-2 type transport system permease protein
MSKYLAVLKVGLADRFAYRANFFLGTLVRIVPFITTVFFWRAVIDDNAGDAFNGYTSTTMTGYFILVFVARTFSSMPGLARAIATDIREGGLNRYLVRPIDYGAYQLALRIAHKAVYLVTAGVPFAVFMWLMRDYLPIDPDPGRIAAAVAAMLMSFLIGFYLHALVGLTAFWFLEITTFLFIYDMIEYFLSGHMIPLDLLPGWFQAVLGWLPFQFTAYLPAAILLGRVEPAECWRLLALEAAWAIALFAIARRMYRRGLQRYSAYGG